MRPDCKSDRAGSLGSCQKGGSSMSEHHLDELCEILDSKRVPLSAMQRAKRQGPYPYYGAQSIIDYVDDYLLDGEYLLVAEDGANLVTRTQDIANIVRGKIWVNNHAHILGYNGKCPLELLGFILNHSNISPYVTGCAQPKLNQDNLRRIRINLPEKVDEVSSILSDLNSKIAVNRRICENLEAQAQALFKHWFIDFAPFKNGKFVESELGMIPEGWRVGTLGEIAEISSGKRPKSRYNNQTKEHNIPLIGASCIMGYTDDIFTSNRILLTGRVGTLGVVQRFNSACWPSDNTLVLSTNFYEFVYQTIKTVNYSAMNRGTSQPLITQGDLKKTLITIPSNSILNKYEEVAGDIMSYIDFHFKESTRLSTLRDTLLPKLMSGQIKV